MAQSDQDAPAKQAATEISTSFDMPILMFSVGCFLLLFTVVTVAVNDAVRLSVTLAAVSLLCLSISAWFYLRVEKANEVRRQEKIQRVLGEGTSSDYFERLVSINVENLSAYYITVKGHANKSFLASLIVGVAGFVLIAFGISKTLSGNMLVSTLSGASGVATEFVSAVFFYLYSQTVRQMKEYHDSLLAVQNILLSLKLVDGDLAPDEKSKMIGSMLQYLVGHGQGRPEI